MKSDLRSNAYFINSDAKSNNGVSLHDKWIERGVAVTSGDSYDIHARIGRGSTVLIWANGVGVVAGGVVLDDEPAILKAGQGTVSPKEDIEYHRRVCWHSDLRQAPITAAEVKAYMNSNPRFTVQALDKGREQILDLVAARAEHLDIADLELTSRDATTRFALAEARRGQGKYRDDLLALWGGRCAVTGCEVLPVLRASHAKAWRDSSHAERLDPCNGLPLAANLDALFDRGLISFDDAGAMLVAPTLRAEDQKLLGLPAPLRQPLNHTQKLYLRHHRERFALGA